MPNAWRKAKLSGGISRLLCNIRSKRPDSSPLVVQTGFPTSLADIVVKNRSRLKKPKSAKGNHTVPPDSFGCRVSEIISAVEFRGEVCAPSDLAPVEEDSLVHFGREFDGVDRGRARPPLLSDPEEPSNDDAPAPPPLQAAANVGRRAFGIQAKLAVASVVLSACSICACRNLVLGITTATIGLLLLESVVNRLLVRTRTTGDETDAKEAAIGGGGDPSGSERMREVDDVHCERRRIALDIDDGKVVADADLGCGKRRRGKRMAYGLRHSPGSVKDSDGVDGRGSNPHCNPSKGANGVRGKRAATSKDQQMVSVRPKYLVLILVVLSGLIVGRVLALGLTVAWWYLVKFTGGGLVPGLHMANRGR